MKKIKIIIVLILISITGFGQNEIETRSINWVHGFMGNKDSWKGSDEYFSQRFDINTARIEYPSIGGVSNAAQIAKQQLISNGNRPMVIAHSMGGVVTRKMYELGADIDGYVTFGTPHTGAYFVNSYHNGDVEAFVEEFTNQVFTDVLVSILQPFTDAIIGKLFDLFGSEQPGIISNLVFTFIEEKIKNETDEQTIQDLSAGGAFISDLIEPPIPKINYYGTAESPVHWRFLASYIDGNNSNEYLVEKMDDLRTLYETVRIVSLATSTTCLSLPYLFNPGCFTLGLYANNLSQQLSQAVLTLDRSEAAWLSLIGAIVENSEECYTVKEVVGWDYNKDGIYDETDRIMRDSCEWENHVELDSDSILITFDLPCDEGFKILKDNDSKERRPDPCHDFVELFAYNTYCYTVYEGESTDGLVVFYASKESNPTAWIEINMMNHQELRLHPKGREHIEFLFRQEGLYSDGKFKFFEVKMLN